MFLKARALLLVAKRPRELLLGVARSEGGRLQHDTVECSGEREWVSLKLFC